MNVFWKDKPLAAQQAKLLNLVLAAHDKSAQRGNISTIVLCNSAAGKGDYFSALSAALSSVGGIHAPLIQTYIFLASFDPEQMDDFRRHVEMGGKVPGWGNSFHQGEPDPFWKDVDAHIAEHWPEHHAKLQRVTDELHARGKMVHPNPSAFTATAATILELPPQIIGWILVQGRLSSWSLVFLKTIMEQNAPKTLNPSEKEAA